MKKLTLLIVWALLCLLKPKAETCLPDRQEGPKLKAYLLITLLVCLFSGQLRAQEVKALRLGDKLPEEFWQQQYSFYKDGTIIKKNLADYRGKLFILDFWATWCSTCFHKFPFLDSIAKVQDEKLGILMVNTTQTKDDLAKIKNSLTKYAEGKPFGLATIYGDEYLLKLFPHQMLSHYVWINKEGQLIAITGSDLVNAGSINISIKRFNKH